MMFRDSGRSGDTILSLDAGMIVGGSVVLLSLIALSASSSDLAGETLTRNTVRLSLSWYAVALCLMMRLGPADWLATSHLESIRK